MEHRPRKEILDIHSSFLQGLGIEDKIAVMQRKLILEILLDIRDLLADN